jgi:serine/threonine protein kinase
MSFFTPVDLASGCDPFYPGDAVEHYRIEALVSSGGMAAVFRAVDTQTGARVALKVPHPDAECDPVLFDRFRRAAAIGRLLHHPGVAEVLPEARHNRVYMVVEWLEGRSLRS